MQPAKKYTPSGTFSPASVGVLGAVALGVGGAIGAAVGYFSVLSGIYLIVAFPLGMGFFASFLLAKSAELSKVRNPLLILIAGVAMGAMMYGSMRYTEYFASLQQALVETKAEFATELDESEEDLDFDTLFYTFIDAELEKEVGASGFIGYMLMEAKEGVEIGKPSSDNGINIGTTGTYILWLVEFALMAGIPAWFAAEQAKKPFCEAHEQWYLPGKVVGVIPVEKQGEALIAFKAGTFDQIKKFYSTEEVSIPYSQITVGSCPDMACREPQFTSFEMVTVDGKGNKQITAIETGIVDRDTAAVLS